MRLPSDKVNITWGELNQILRGYPERLAQIEQAERIHQCYEEQPSVEKATADNQ